MTSDKPKKASAKGKKVLKPPIKVSNPANPTVDAGIKPTEKGKPAPA